ncbi:ABC transporter permease [Sulfuriflexus sp.]|uniref:ABC transporter permease n=1 Tax=Sulfuriflexus sp. TaxID=2015443 RepID=UPI0028CC3278|nr:ABC transporter permease [Sulfuriflexus sp.]MDT8404524.1 ABC transporter permease [Sulfuriflexus sp.]
MNTWSVTTPKEEDTISSLDVPESNATGTADNIQDTKTTDEINARETGGHSSGNKESRLFTGVRDLPWDRYFVRGCAIVGAIILWQILSAYQVNFVISFQNIPTPVVVWEHFVKLLGSQEYYKHITVSLERIIIAFTSASLLGMFLGIFMGRSQIFSDIMMPYIEILRPIPAVAWIPLSILAFPTEESSIIYITFLGAFFPVILNTVHGVEQTPESLIRAAKSLGASGRAIMWHVVLPGALPSIMAGLAIGMGVSWFSLLAGEIISGQYGIGYFTWNSYTLVEYPNIIIGMLTIGGLGTLSTWLVKQASKPALRWQEHKD